jgi:hypothetical protein
MTQTRHPTAITPNSFLQVINLSVLRWSYHKRPRPLPRMKNGPIEALTPMLDFPKQASAMGFGGSAPKSHHLRRPIPLRSKKPQRAAKICKVERFAGVSEAGARSEILSAAKDRGIE